MQFRNIAKLGFCWLVGCRPEAAWCSLFAMLDSGERNLTKSSWAQYLLDSKGKRVTELTIAMVESMIFNEWMLLEVAHLLSCALFVFFACSSLRSDVLCIPL